MRRPSPWSLKRPRDLTVWSGDWCWCWRWWPGRGVSLPLAVPLPGDAHLKGFIPAREVFEAMKQPQLEVSATTGDPTPVPASLTLKKFPTLDELLADPCWEGGVHKGCRRLMVFVEGTIVKVLVGVENQRIKAMITGRSLDEALAGWETLLKADKVPWEQEKAEGERKPGKRR